LSGTNGNPGKLFKLRQNKTDPKIEILAGLTTFVTMAYIIFVNPTVLSSTGMDFGAVMVAPVSQRQSELLLWANGPIIHLPLLREWV